jgi:two-component sensor histidine kinase
LELYGFTQTQFRQSTQDWRSSLFPADREKAIAALEQSLRTGAFDVEFRIVRRDTGEVRWMHGCGKVFFESEMPARMVGINVDITSRKLAEERESLLVQELQHRTKNHFSVVQALAQLTLRGSETLDQARRSFLNRLQTLEKANRRLSESRANAVSLMEIVQDELGPYGDRVIIQGSDIQLDARDAQNFALALHELATNAAKYGSLLTTDGTVIVQWQAGIGTLKFSWRESGGPKVVPPKCTGFGTSLLAATLGAGSAEYAPTGFSYMVEVLLAPISPTILVATNGVDKPCAISART